MRLDDFISSRTGQLHPISGIRGVSHAFIPAQLPPEWEWPVELWPFLLEAHKAVANLEGTGKHLPNPELVLRPLQNREAQKSSSLEGTYTDPQQQMLFAMDPELPRSPEDPVNARMEVFNYLEALRLRRERHDLPISLRLIRELHRVLMEGVRGADRSPGNFRRLQNQIGRPPRFVPPPVTHLPGLLDDFERYLHSDPGFDPLVKAFIAHYQFEAIHPFMDGNGRVGRLLLAITIAEWCELSNQWLYMSDYFDRNKDTYIDLMYGVSSEGGWTEWIRFCLSGVVEQATDTLARYERLISLHRDFHERVNQAGGSVRLSSLVDDLFLIPVVIASRAARSLQVTYPTARSDLSRLEALGIVNPLEEAKQVSYYCPAIFDIIYQD